MILKNLRDYAALMRLDKPIGIFLLLWPTLMALWVASNGIPTPSITAIFVAGVIIMRSAGCVINDIADYKLDRVVARTKNRPLAQERLELRLAWLLFFGLLCLAFLIALCLNFFALMLAPCALAIAICYPYIKRVSHFPQLVLGAAFSTAILMAFAAIQNQIPITAYLLYSATLLWVVAYDTQYAMADRMDDIKAGAKSTAILFGKNDKQWIAGLQLTSLILFAWMGHISHFGIIYYASLAIALLLIIYQQWLIRDRIPSLCIQAFKNNNFFGAVIFLGIFLQYLY